MSSSTNDKCEVDDLSKTLMAVFERFVVVKDGFSKAVELLKGFIERQCKRRIAFEITKVHGQSKFIATRHDPWAYAECDDIPTLCCILDKSMKSIKEIGLYEYRVSGLTDARETYQKIMELLDSATGAEAVKKSLGFTDVVTVFPGPVKQRRRRGPNKNPRKRKGQNSMMASNADPASLGNIQPVTTNQDVEKTPTVAEVSPTKETALPMDFENLVAKLYECTKLEQSDTTSKDTDAVHIPSVESVSPHSNIDDSGVLAPLSSANTNQKTVEQNASIDMESECGLTIVEEPEEVEQPSTPPMLNVKKEEKTCSYFDALVRDPPELTVDKEGFGEGMMSILMKNINEVEQSTAPSGIGVKRRSVDVDLSLHKRINVNPDICDRPTAVFDVVEPNAMPQINVEGADRPPILNRQNVNAGIHQTVAHETQQNPMPPQVHTEGANRPLTINCQDDNVAAHRHFPPYEPSQNPTSMRNRSFSTADAPPRVNPKRRNTIQEDVEVIDLTREQSEFQEAQRYQPLPQHLPHLQQPQNHLFAQTPMPNWPQLQNPLPPSYLPSQQNQQLPQVSPYPNMYPHPRFQYPAMNSNGNNEISTVPNSGIWPPMHPQTTYPMPAQYQHLMPSQTQPQLEQRQCHTFQQYANHAFMISQQNQQREATLDFYERQTLESLARIPPHIRAQMLQMLEQQRKKKPY